MRRIVTAVMVGLVLVGTAVATAEAEEKVITTQKTKDTVITLKNEAGQWKQGKNTFTLEITSSKDQQPIDAGKVALSTSMAMPGMAPMLAGATLTPDGLGRYRGTIQFADSGTRQVTVTWDGPGGKGAAKFSVPVR